MLRDLFSLFPAHAGVILAGGKFDKLAGTFPRTCGGDPSSISMLFAKLFFSPHMRG